MRAIADRRGALPGAALDVSPHSALRLLELRFA